VLLEQQPRCGGSGAMNVIVQNGDLFLRVDAIQNEDVSPSLRVTYAGNAEWKQRKLGSRFFVPYSRCVQAIVNREQYVRARRFNCTVCVQQQQCSASPSLCDSTIHRRLLALLKDATGTLEKRYFLYATRRLEAVKAVEAEGTAAHLRDVLAVKELSHMC
jgi:hypothetical protein